ncbi:MAG: DUF4382 domain-containing protein [Candidatus Liptonbacteria bacterium]|nr:DUF4382 domain-containing protein [Candidatus Liptonbacteria bacterium]
MSKKPIVMGALAVVILGAALVYFAGNRTTTNTMLSPASGQGKLVIGITDAAAEIQNVSSIMMTVEKVEVQSAAQGWITVASSSKQYDLLQLKQTGAVALLADVNLSAGTYDQLRLTISKVLVTASGTVQEAKLPSGTLKIVGRLVILDGKTATAVLDFKADKSLHVTGNGKFILTPVVNLKTKSDASVEKKSDDTLKIDGGKDEDNVNVGMDERGDTKEDFELDENAKFELEVDNVIHIRNRGEGKDQKTETESEEGVKFNLSSQNNSGIAGAATLENTDGKVKVTFKLDSVPTGVLGLLGVSIGSPHPAHIHLGSCATLGAVKYPLNSTVDGKSETTINASLADLKAQLPLAVNVHKSPEESGVYVACADIKL